MRFRFKVFAAGVGLTLALSACGDAPDSSDEPSRDDFPIEVPASDDYDENAEFVMAESLMPSSFDPYASSSGLDQNYMAPIYDRLIYRTPSGEFEPMLATEWTPSEDLKSLTLKLREGVKFTDGTPFDAEAVKANLDHYRSEGSKILSEVSRITDVEVVDEYTVKVTVSSGLGAVTSSLSARAGMMSSPKGIKEGTLASNPVGTGPYKVIEATPGTRVVLERNPDYWDPEAQRVAKLTVVAMPDAQTRYNALASGEATAAAITVDQSKTIDEDRVIVAGPTPLIYFLAINTATAPFDDPNVREAMSLAIDREDISEGLYGGFCDPQVQMFGKGTIGYSEEIGDGLDQWPYDPDKATQLLEDAGVDPGTAYDANVTDNDTVDLAEVIQAQLKQVGMSMNVKPGPPATLLEEFAFAKTSPLTVSGYTGQPDPAGVLDRNFVPEALYNPGGEMPQEMLDIGQQAASETDPEVRNELYSQWTELFLEEVRNIIPICLTNRLIGADDSVTGLHAATDYTDLRYIAVSPE
ncbi:MAG: ABC transporter substrate-binding protein [Cumulibacter sp.]